MGKLTQKSSFTILLLFLLLIVAACDVVPGNIETPSGELFNTEAGDTQPLAVSSSWLASGPGTVQILGDGVMADPSMSYVLNPSGYTAKTWELSTTANEDGTITLLYEYTGFHSFFRVTVFAEAFVTGTSGTTTIPLIGDGPINCCTPPSAGFTYSGEVTISVQEGDTFGFRFGGSHFDGTNELRGIFTVDLNKPYTKDECKNSGWEIFGFKNQGQCVRFIETGQDSRYFSLD
jgi:hypothetical protein